MARHLRDQDHASDKVSLGKSSLLGPTRFQMLQNQFRYSIRRLAMRKMPNIFQHNSSISSREISVLPLRLTRQITKIRPSLNHQRRCRQRLHLAKSLLQIVIPSIPGLSLAPSRTISISRDHHPAGLQVSHCIRANPTGSSCTFSTPPSTERNHWYQNRLDCSNEGTLNKPRG
jgi:hypothetical protein